MTGHAAAERLRLRANSYSRDALVLRADGDILMATAFTTIAKELRDCAAEVDEPTEVRA